MEHSWIKELLALVHLDIDAFHAYGHALRHVDVAMVKEQLERFQADHERHVNELSEALVQHGAEAPGFSRDFRGFIMEGFTAIRSVTGTEGALKAMRTNEVQASRQYDQQHWIHLPPSVREILLRFQHDEHRHLQYIEQAIDVRIWEPDEGSSRIILPVQARGVV